jgi:hypothetical protein
LSAPHGDADQAIKVSDGLSNVISHKAVAGAAVLTSAGLAFLSKQATFT